MNGILQPVYHLIDVLFPFEWLQPSYMKRALLAVLMIAPMCSGLGVPVVSFRMVFFSSAISHSVFAGVALGILLGVAPEHSVFSMIAFGMIIGLGITHVRRRSELSNDTVIGVFFSMTVALGIAIISARPDVARNLQGIIFGDILTISPSELALFLVLSILTACFLIVSYNRLILKGINERLASTAGVKTRFYEYAFSLLLAMVVTASVRVVGLLLVTAMFVVPAGAGRNLARSVRQQFWFTMLIGIVCGVAGLAASYYLNSATGATIILISAVVFMVTQYAPSLARRIAGSTKRRGTA